MKDNSMIKSVLKSHVQAKIDEAVQSTENAILVFMGIEQFADIDELSAHIADLETYSINGNKKVFNKAWFSSLFPTLLAPLQGDYHILSFAQFSYLISYVAPDFFKDRIVIIRDGLRNLLPISKEEYIEKSESENLESRPEDMPDYMAEQIQIGDNYFYSPKMPVEQFRIIDIFSEQEIMSSASSDNDCEVIDIVNDPLGMDTFMSKCLDEANFNRHVAAKFFNKHPMEDRVMALLERLNWLLQQFGGSVQILNETEIEDEHQPSERAVELLHEYWGDDAMFRNIKVYSNPSYNKDIKSISQGLIVDTVIDEYQKATNGIKPKDLFLTAPTGAGKSLLFQLPAFHVSSCGDVTIVVSPLIALMKDQVEQIRRDRGFKKVYYINSELSLIDRERVIDDCKNGEIDILYLSPELLLSYDISYFIGDRRLGLIVIDEAHLITTWGRDFRVDYWFLGQHINKIRKIKDYYFPMVAVTATAIYGGDNDMVFDSTDSLCMDYPHIFIGEIKREDITFVIDNHEKFSANHDSEKINETVAFIEQIAELGIKTIVYAPYRRHIDAIMQQLQLNGKKDIAVPYHSGLSADEKSFAYEAFKKNDAKVMISTKAFGMGVDIPDIQLVYHHAPSGLLPDYIQEIGRAARKKEIRGFAALSYAAQDQAFSKKLYGISALRHFQIREVINKIYKLYIANKKKRNMLVAADDFNYIFNETNDLDQKVMTSLMMIEKDYAAKTRFNVLIARPKKLFVKVYSRVNDYGLSLLAKRYRGCFTKIAELSHGYTVVELDLDKIWVKSFSDISFPMLKKTFYDGNLLQDAEAECKPQVKLTFNLDASVDNIYMRLEAVLDNIQSCFSRLTGHFFTKDEMEEALAPLIDDKKQCEKIVKFILASYSQRGFQYDVDSDAFLQRRTNKKQVATYRIINTRYNNCFASLKRRLLALKDTLDKKISIKYASLGTQNLLDHIRLGSLIEILGMGTYESRGGDTPMIFIRINDPRRIAKDASDNSYRNSLLRTIENRHKISSEIFDHFFLKSFDNQQRWDFIEDFFLGEANDELFSKYPGGERNHVDIVSYIKERADHLIDEEEESESTQEGISTFAPREGQTYYDNSMLTIDGVTKKLIRWISDDPVALDKVRREFNLRFPTDSYNVLHSRLVNRHFTYYRDSKGLRLYIDFPGYSEKVMASCPYRDVPVKFYHWWRKNEDKVTLTKAQMIQLFLRVNQLDETALLKRHRDMLRKSGF